MAIPKLFKAVHTLDKYEWSSFGKFLLMQLREESDNYRLYKVLRKHNNNLLDRGKSETLRLLAFPNMVPKTYSNMLSRVFLLFEKWFAIEMLSKRQYLLELSLVENYNKRGLFKLANIKFHKLEKSILSSDITHPKHARILFELYATMYYSYNPQRKDEKIFSGAIELYLKSHQQQTLTLILEAENKKRLGSGEDIENIINKLETQLTEVHTTFINELLSSTLELFRQNNSDSLNRVKQALESERLSETSDLFLIISFYLRFHVHRMYQNGILSDRSLYIDVYRLNITAIDKNPHQTLSEVNLANAVGSLAAFSSYTVIENLIIEWAPKVKSKNPESFIEYCKCINVFRHEKYENLSSRLTKLKLDEIEIMFSIQAMLLISYFMTDEDDLLNSGITNIKKQLKRNENKVSQVLYKSMSNFLAAMTLILKAKYHKSIDVDLKKYDILYFRSWFEKKIDDEGRFIHRPF